MTTLTRAIIASLLTLAIATPATANTPDVFHACAKKEPDARCRESISVLAGKTVYLKGKVSPPHANLEAELRHLGPDDASWKVLATVPIGDLGAMKYTWETTTADGSQTDPHWFQFRIPDHGDSNAVEVMVFFGE
jgi:hypothetical protein